MIPNLVVMAPRDEDQLRHMLATGLARTDGPSALRYPRSTGIGVPLHGCPRALPIGKAETLTHGTDLCLLAVGSLVQPALLAAANLQRLGFGAEVVDMRFIKPLDEALLRSIWAKHRLVLTLEENSLIGGFGAAILEWSAGQENGQAVQVVNLGIPDAFQEHATRAELLADLALDAPGLTERCLDLLGGREVRASAQSAS
jgi:1-deoxy-D-xylulose-5-phosphate synthase